MSPADRMTNLRMNALTNHQVSMGRGDELVQILKRTVEQLERTHSRIQNMSTILFVVGLLVLGVGIYQVVAGRQGAEVWSVLLGGIGGVTTLAATFWTAPLEKMSNSIRDLVKLEAAFLGYIRVVGELDSFFQMHYVDSLAGETELTLDQVMSDTANQVKDLMTHTLELIDKHVSGQGPTLTKLQEHAQKLEERIKALEAGGG